MSFTATADFEQPGGAGGRTLGTMASVQSTQEQRGAGTAQARKATGSTGGGASAEVVIALENLVKMKRVFEEADQDGSGELDPDEFYEKLGPFLGPGLSQTQVAQLFMRIDADCGGTIDWEEFTNYFFLQRASTSTVDGGADWRLHAQDFWRKEWRGSSHKEAVEQLYCCASLDQYITGGRSGQLRVWSAENLAPLQSISNSGSWITDCTVLEGHAAKKLAVAAQDRTITFYNAMRSGFEYSGRLTCPGSLGPPLCLGKLEWGLEAGGQAAPRLMWGDTEGSVMLLRCDPPLLPTPRQLAPRKDFEVLHSVHSDWVTRVQHIPEVGLVSSSLDATLCMLDLERGKLAARVALHRKGVRCFGYSPAFSLVASGGIERSVLLWQPKGNVSRAVGELPGHSAGVQQLVVADEQSQVITLSNDHAVRVWDLRNHKCVQTIGAQDWLRPEDTRPTALCHDSRRRRLICATHRPTVWSHRIVEVEGLHDSRLVGALYNATFSVVVSGDEGGTICLWNLQTGRREGGFSLHAHSATASWGVVTARGGGSGAIMRTQQKLTALAFDAHQRRLLTASDCGEVKMWNFNSGAVLRQYLHREGRKEITAVAFVRHGAADAASDMPVDDAGAVQEQEQQLDGVAAAATDESWMDGLGQVAAAATTDTEGYSDLSEHAMLSMQQHRAQQMQQAQRASHQHLGSQTSAASQAASRSGGSCSLVLATGWSRHLCVWEEGEEARPSEYRRLEGHKADVLSLALLNAEIAATGDFEGELRVWHLPSATCLATLSYGGAQFDKAVRKLCWLPPTDGDRGAPALLLACGEDGGLQFWQVSLPVELRSRPATAEAGTARTCSSASGDASLSSATSAHTTCHWCLAARIAATHRPQDCVTALCVDDNSRQVWTGDSSGHVAAWDASALCCGAAAAAASADGTSPWAVLPQRLLLWRASEAPIVSLDPMAAGQGLLLVGAQDAAISIWTQQGGLVGVFGQHSWDLEDQATWQDPCAEAVPPPLAADISGSGLTPREIIEDTPRRTSWLQAGHRGSVTARSGGGARLPSASGSKRDSKAAEELADALEHISKVQLSLKDGGGASAACSSSVDAGSHSGMPEALAAGHQRFSLKAGAVAAAGAAACAAGMVQNAKAASAGGAAAVELCLAPRSAGARLAELVADAAASKAACWTIPVHVQAHSTLPLQRMVEVAPPSSVVTLGRGRGASGERRRSSSPSQRSRRDSASPQTIAAIMRQASTTFGRHSRAAAPA